MAAVAMRPPRLLVKDRTVEGEARYPGRARYGNSRRRAIVEAIRAGPRHLLARMSVRAVSKRFCDEVATRPISTIISFIYLFSP